MDELEQDIYNYYRIKYQDIKIKWVQSGSGRISVNRHIINYREYNGDNGTDTVIFAGRDRKKRACFSLKIYKTGEAILESVDRRKNCFIDDHANSKDLVKAAFQIAKNKGAKRLELTDNSFIQCPEKISLADLYFLTTGKTWYESIIPLKCGKQVMVDKFRELVKTNSWSSVYIKLIELNPDFQKYDFEVDNDINKIGSAMEVLSKLKKSGKHCNFFSEYMYELLLCSGIQSLRNFTWSILL